MTAYANHYELCDLEAAPPETTNLAYDPAYRKQQDELEQQLKELERSKLLVVTQ